MALARWSPHGSGLGFGVVVAVGPVVVSGSGLGMLVVVGAGPVVAIGSGLVARVHVPHPPELNPASADMISATLFPGPDVIGDDVAQLPTKSIEAGPVA